MLFTLNVTNCVPEPEAVLTLTGLDVMPDLSVQATGRTSVGGCELVSDVQQR